MLFLGFPAEKQKQFEYDLYANSMKTVMKRAFIIIADDLRISFIAEVRHASTSHLRFRMGGSAAFQWKVFEMTRTTHSGFACSCSLHESLQTVQRTEPVTNRIALIQPGAGRALWWQTMRQDAP